MPASIRISPETVTNKITRHLTGSCMEDVNHEVYGGIYSQMIFGESFEEEPMTIDARLDAQFAGLSGTVSCLAEREYLTDDSPVRSWQPFRRGSAGAEFHVSSQARRGRHSQRVRFIAGDGDAGIENRGLNRWGMNFVAGKNYEVTVVAKAEPKDKKEVEVFAALESADGSKIYDEKSFTLHANGEWQIIQIELTPDTAATNGRFALKLRAPGCVYFDYAALHPGEWGRFKGLRVRKDIADALVNQGLTVMRYGGWMINTRHLEERGVCPVYRWKNMIGQRHDRPPYHGTFYQYNSNGFGIIDFIAFCNAAGFLAVPVLNSREEPQDVADFIEYVNGDASTKWGAQRAADGFPEPMNVRFIEIGNEEWSADYIEEFGRLSDVIAKTGPDITSIMAMWLGKYWFDRNKTDKLPLERLVHYSNGKKVLLDIHVGGDNLADADGAESIFAECREFIDSIDPDNEILFCVLEENGGRHDLQRALGHAHIVNTAERWGGQVLIDCPANCLQPFKQNDNHWDQGQVFFTPDKAWGMPPYYAQQMIARNYLPLCVQAKCDSSALDITATKSEDGKTVVLKAVNLEASPVEAAISFGNNFRAAGVKLEVLKGELTAVNTPDEPERIVPERAALEPRAGEFMRTFPGHSFTVLKFEAR